MATTYTPSSAVQLQSVADATTRTEACVAAGRMVPLPAGDVRLICLEGELWLTREGDVEDYILRAGQSFNVVGTEHVAVQALKSSCVRLVN